MSPTPNLDAILEATPHYVPAVVLQPLSLRLGDAALGECVLKLRAALEAAEAAEKGGAVKVIDGLLQSLGLDVAHRAAQAGQVLDLVVDQPVAEIASPGAALRQRGAVSRKAKTPAARRPGLPSVPPPPVVPVSSLSADDLF